MNASRSKSQSGAPTIQWLGALFCLLATSCGKAEELPLSGVLITIDTTNTACLDIYGTDRGLTPYLMALSKESVVYDRAHTVAPITLPAHSSMMTGLYPLRHGVRENGLMELSGDAETLAEYALEAGFETAAFVSALVLSEFYGIGQGFEAFDEPALQPSKGMQGLSKRSAVITTDNAIAWLAERDEDRPFFLWVHYFDPHQPYDPPKKFVEKANGSLYRAEVAAMDEQIGRLLEALGEEVGLDELTLAVVADHGESFGAHGEATHSVFCYEETMRVPFLLRFADGRRAGTRSDEIVSVVDLFPTFMSELGLGSASEVDGINLAIAPVPATRGVYLESYSGYINYGWSPLAGWLDAEGKYLHSSTREFYDLANDPGELSNLLADGEVDTASYTDSLEALSRLPRLTAGSGVTLSEEQIADLRALGYAGGGGSVQGLPDPLEPSDRPSPLDRTEQYGKFLRAMSMAKGGRNKIAIKLLNEILEENPANVFALETLGSAYMGEERFEEAIEAHERLLAMGEDRYLARITLGTAYENLGQLEMGLKHYRRAEELNSGNRGLTQAIKRIEAKIAAAAPR